MCGIFGGTPELIVKDAAQLLLHRGPDQQGQVVVRARDGQELIIGQTRLSVVYKKDVQTPMQRDGAVISFNGEIYNWADLRRQLEDKGWKFHTPTVGSTSRRSTQASPSTSSWISIWWTSPNGL